MFPTLAEVLALPVVQAGGPRVRSGSNHLDVPVRWVHVSEQRNPAGTLSGGELLLSIGVSLADRARNHMRGSVKRARPQRAAKASTSTI